MTVLVDANVLSEPTKAKPDVAVIEWLRANESQLAVDPIVVGELRFGILLLPRGARRARLEAWFDGVAHRLRCVPWDAATGVRWAQLLADLRARGKAMPIKDSMIAATALANGFPLATMNQRDFAHARVKLVVPR